MLITHFYSSYSFDFQLSRLRIVNVLKQLAHFLTLDEAVLFHLAIFLYKAKKKPTTCQYPETVKFRNPGKPLFRKTNESIYLTIFFHSSFLSLHQLWEQLSYLLVLQRSL